LTKLPAAHLGTTSASAFHRELERARRHLAKLEAEQQRYQPPLTPANDVNFDESPVIARTCNALIWVIVAAPFVLALAVLVRRLIG
jgi:hypothetical protein